MSLYKYQYKYHKWVKWASTVTVYPYAVRQVKSPCIRHCELCKRQNAALEHFVGIKREKRDGEDKR